MKELLAIATTPELLWALVVFAAVIPVELAFGTGRRPALAERLGNVGAMVVNLAVGGALLAWVLSQPWAEGWMDFPQEPRLAALENRWLWAVAALFLVDGLYYVYHRLQHSVPLLWRIHALHHSDPAVNVTTSRRTHFLERPLQFLLLALPVLWLLGVNAEGAALFSLAGPFLLYFAHVDVRLPLGPLTAVVVGPQYHRVHHALDSREHGVNFAQAFPLFDIVGGTYRRPRPGEYVETGIEGCKSAEQRWKPILF